MKNMFKVLVVIIGSILFCLIVILAYFVNRSGSKYMGTPKSYIRSSSIIDSKKKGQFICEYHYNLDDIPQEILLNVNGVIEPVFYLEKKPTNLSPAILTEKGKNDYEMYNFQLVRQKAFRYRTDGWLPFKEVPDSALINIYENGVAELNKIGEFYVYKDKLTIHSEGR